LRLSLNLIARKKQADESFGEMYEILWARHFPESLSFAKIFWWILEMAITKYVFKKPENTIGRL
jgi:hypothetical protein